LLTDCPFTLVCCLYPLLVQLILEVGEHLEELALREKLSPMYVASNFC